MANRMQEGLKIYRKGLIEMELIDDDLIIFTVQGSKNSNYQVSMNENQWLCDCDDYQWRSEKEPGSYICKHLWAAFFKVAELNLK
ncbi:MAG: SWIM zinc finger family protein [Methanobacterium sp.]